MPSRPDRNSQKGKYEKSPVRRLGFDMLWFCGLGLFLLMATEYLIAVSKRSISQVSVIVPGKGAVIVRVETR